MMSSIAFQTTLSPTSPKSHFAYLIETHSMDGVMGMSGDMLHIIRPLEKEGNNMLVAIIVSFIFLHLFTYWD
jgi:hypothetical protein